MIIASAAIVMKISSWHFLFWILVILWKERRGKEKEGRRRKREEGEEKEEGSQASLTFTNSIY
ncbi:MAG: hypothetical protein HDS26_05685 [Bacteroides sp.]|nr:hypothetical protein [Bacteroides sp.]